MDSQVDWELQWSLHAPNFKDGKAHIRLPKKQKIELLPGPGFGDFSHTTTRLMVELMPMYVRNKIVFDIGCGSGILSVAAAKLGAIEVYAHDIDPQAVSHTEKNALHNDVKISTQPPKSFPQKPAVLMNMIFSEQMIAWKEHGCPFDILMTSGIRAEEKLDYIDFAVKNGWELIDMIELKEWIVSVFREFRS